MRSVVLMLTLGAVSTAAAQQQRPDEWKVRFDHANASDTALTFVDMPPGWHITTGPAGIFYNPDNTTQGQYRVQATIFLFDPGRRHREAYGVLFGGTDLATENQAYAYFLLRDTGEFLVKRRNGADTETVVPWTASDAIMKYPGGTEQAKNVLAVDVGADSVAFLVNGQRVTSVARSQLPTDGIVGLRVNHNLNVHVSELTIEPKGTSSHH